MQRVYTIGADSHCTFMSPAMVSHIGKRDGVFYDATILESVELTIKINCVEAFSPVTTMQPFADFKLAVEIANDSVYGPKTGVFTTDINKAMYAFSELEVGGVVINDVPSFRVDNMPYGDIRDSGLGREGIRIAMEDMTEIKIMVMNNLGVL